MKENVIRFSDVESCIIELRDQRVLLDRDVAMLYDVETKEINQAVKNNPDKFPAGYLIECNKVEKAELVKNFDRFNPLKHSTALPTAFTEKGLYMLATILKVIRQRRQQSQSLKLLQESRNCPELFYSYLPPMKHSRKHLCSARVS